MQPSLLYLIFILDFPLIFHDKFHSPNEDAECNKATALTFVDDINSTSKEEADKSLQDTMLNNLDECKEYMNANKLALNRPKTKTFAITDDINIADSLSIPAVPNAVRNTNIINILGIRV